MDAMFIKCKILWNFSKNQWKVEIQRAITQWVFIQSFNSNMFWNGKKLEK